MYPTIASIMTPKPRKAAEESSEPPVPTPMLLDTYDAYLAYSFRKLRTNYTGACIRVRRSSDNAEQDIGFVDGYIDKTALLDFCGSGNGFIRTWYDQSGNSINWQRANDISLQPFIVSNGSLFEIGGKVAMYSVNEDSLVTNSISLTSSNIMDVSIFNAPVTNNFFIIGCSTSNSEYYTTAQAGSTSGTSQNSGFPQLFVDGVVVENTRDAYHQALTGNGIKAAITTGLNLSAWRFIISKYPVSTVNEVDYYFEKIIFNNDDIRQGVENNINSYYSL